MKESEYRKELQAFLESELFKDKIKAYTHKACKELAVMLVKVLSPLVAIVLGLVVYIFFNLSNSVEQLGYTTEKLDRAVTLFDERTKNNQEAIKALLNR